MGNPHRGRTRPRHLQDKKSHSRSVAVVGQSLAARISGAVIGAVIAVVAIAGRGWAGASTIVADWRRLEKMNSQNEHDDDIEPEVIEGAEIETENYGDGEALEDTERGPDATNQSSGPTAVTEIDEEETDGEASDTI
jgi:hypothetical protein